MIRRPPRSTRTDTLFPYTTRFRSNSNLTDRRNSGAGPLKTPGYFIPNILQNATHASNVKRRQINAALQWQASNDLEVYLDGLYTRFKTPDIDSGFNVQPFTPTLSVPAIGSASCRERVGEIGDI